MSSDLTGYYSYSQFGQFGCRVQKAEGSQVTKTSGPSSSLALVGAPGTYVQLSLIEGCESVRNGSRSSETLKADFVTRRGGLKKQANVRFPPIADINCRSHNLRRRGRVELARYSLRANGAAGPVDFQERLTIEAALIKAQELRDAHFSHFTIFNVLTGVEITDVEALLATQEKGAGNGIYFRPKADTSGTAASTS